MKKVYDLLWKKSEDKGKAKWERVGVLIEKEDGKKSVKIDLVPAGNWDGWLHPFGIPLSPARSEARSFPSLPPSNPIETRRQDVLSS